MKQELIIPVEIKNQAEKTALMAKSYQITDKNSLEMGSNLLIGIYRIRKTLADKQDSIIKPMREAIKATQAMFSPYIDSLEMAEKELKGKVASYKVIEEARKMEERKELIKTIDPFDQSEETMGKLALVENEKMDGMFLRNSKTLVIQDESLIPRNYLKPDLVMIRQDLLKGKKVAGCLLEIKKSVVIKQ